MQTKARPRSQVQFEELEQLKSRGNAARNELIEITLSFRNYADSLRDYCLGHRGTRKV